MKTILIKKLFGWLISAIVEAITSKSLLSYTELQQLIADGVIDADPANVNSTSIDITMDNKIMVEGNPSYNKVTSIAEKESIEMEAITMDDGGFILRSGDIMLASTREYLRLPNDISAEYKLKSSQARNFMEHLKAGWIDAGFHGKLTLEFVNLTRNHEHLIKPGMKCGQIVFFRHSSVPKQHSYAAKGQYNGQTEVTASKGIR